ncbi:MAG: hypothetical protein JRE14_10340 [Deltaproteobacteria bacterium]|nr:hypothetical protein [Deltaproteobacteria bacterium]
MTELEKLIKTVADGLKLMAQGVEKLAEKVDDIGKSMSEEDAKPKRKAPAKPKKAAAKVTKKAPAKKEKQVTAADTVLGVIKRHKNGVDTAVIMEKTRYERKKVSNIVFKLKKQGKVKSEKKGVYLKV